MTIYNCGFYLGYLDNLESELSQIHKLDLESIKESLCSFSCEEIIPTRKKHNLRLMDIQLLAVYENILSRGLPTLPSLLIERSLIQLLNSTIVAEEKLRNESIEFIHKTPRLQTGRGKEWLEMLIRAHCIVDPRMNPNNLLANDPFDSEEERIFFYKLLPEYLGKCATQLVEPQRSFESLIVNNLTTEFFGQKVDFAYELGEKKIILEIDGEQHNQPQQKALDTKRDKMLTNNGWIVFRIPVQMVRDGDIQKVLIKLKDLIHNRFFDLVKQNYDKPLWENALGKIAMQLVLTPFAITRIQKMLLTALRSSTLSLTSSEWNVIIIERDVPCAQLAILDFKQNLQAFYKLFEIKEPLPKINLHIYTTQEFSQFETGISETSLMKHGISVKRTILGKEKEEIFAGDLLLDISILQRHSFMHSEVEFYEQHLYDDGAAFVIRSVHTQRGKRQIQSAEPISYPMTNDKLNPLLFFLQNIFRKKKFWEKQPDILNRTLALKPVIGLLPTGGGKSLCYQLSALLQPGVTLVVDPLRSLMFDQAENLKAIGIDNIEFINSEQTSEERERVTDLMGNGMFQIVFIAPERLQIREFRARLQQMSIAFSVPYVVIDEAHCVSEWGHDFRTSYLNLARIAQRYCQFRDIPPTIIALTGTASYAVLTDVQREIGIDDEEAKIYPDTFNRSELKFNIYSISSSQKRRMLLGILNALPNELGIDISNFFEIKGNDTQSGLIFVPHVSDEFGIDVKYFLSKELKLPIEFFSGGIPKTFEPNMDQIEREHCWNEYKRDIQLRFKANQFPLLVCTKAFGMGIDKPNIRYTIHYGIPQSLEAFYQEAGRAGRDKKNAVCSIIFSDDNSSDADQLLNPDLTIDDIAKIPEPSWDQRGDVHRIMWFHSRSFQGFNVEWEIILGLLDKYIYPHLIKLNMNQSQEIFVPFEDDKKENKLEKAIYRLSLIGIVQDYTLDYHKRQFEITIIKKDETEYSETLKNYVARYKILEYLFSFEQKVQHQEGKNLIEKCCGFLIKFVYDEIEMKRRLAIKNMVELARSCNTDVAIREGLLSYLEKTPFTELLLKLVKHIDPKEWWEALDMVKDIESARNLLGGCRRTLESYPDYPGLFILSGLAKLSLPNQEEKSAFDDIRSGLRSLKRQIPNQSIRQEEIVLDILTHSKRKNRNVESNIAEIALDEFPTRAIAKYAYPTLPFRAENILLNLLLGEVNRFNQQFLRRSKNV